MRHRLQPVPVRDRKIHVFNLIKIVFAADVDAVEILLGTVAEVADVPDLRPRSVKLHMRSSRPRPLPFDPGEGAFRRPQREKENGRKLQRRHHCEKRSAEPAPRRQPQQQQKEEQRSSELPPLRPRKGVVCRPPTPDGGEDSRRYAEWTQEMAMEELEKRFNSHVPPLPPRALRAVPAWRPGCPDTGGGVRAESGGSPGLPADSAGRCGPI